MASSVSPVSPSPFRQLILHVPRSGVFSSPSSDVRRSKRVRPSLDPSLETPRFEQNENCASQPRTCAVPCHWPKDEPPRKKHGRPPIEPRAHSIPTLLLRDARIFATSEELRQPRLQQSRAAHQDITALSSEALSFPAVPSARPFGTTRAPLEPRARIDREHRSAHWKWSGTVNGSEESVGWTNAASFEGGA